MGFLHTIAQYQTSRKGVLHATLDPDGPGFVRIHLVPPKFRLFRPASYVLILNGYYILPLGYSWAILLSYFLEEIQRFDGKTASASHINTAVSLAVGKAHRVFGTPRPELTRDLEEMLQLFLEVAAGKEPSVETTPFSLREYAPRMSAPHRMDLMLSAMTTPEGQWRCNLKCRYCYAAGQLRASDPELSTEQWKTIISRCRSAGIPQLTFTGGEPTLRPDLPELIEYARWFVTRLNTNGVLLDEALCRKLASASLDSVQITLYSGDPAIHNRLVGAKSWEKTTSGIRHALDAGLNVSVNTPLCRDNADYCATLSFLQKLGVRCVTCSGLIQTGNASGESMRSEQLTQTELEHILIKAARFCQEARMELQFTSPGQASPRLLQSLRLSVPMCGACLSNMAVSPSGEVIPCQSWLSGASPLGNLLTDSWRGIWNRPQCRSIRAMPEAEALFCPLRQADLAASNPQKGGQTS